MAKKVLIISTSLRGGSNSDILANECAKGAKEVGHDVELLSLKGKDIKYCIGCLSCQRTGMCVQKDDIADIMAKIKNAEVIVYATPIYYYEMCGQMKTLLDRLNPLYSADYLFRDIYYMMATAAESDESAFEKAYNGLQGWVDCFEKASLKGMVGGGGIDAANTEIFLFATYRKNTIYRKCKAVRKCQKALEYGVSGYMQTRGFGRLLYGQIV